MKRFAFRLESLRALREQAEEQARTVLERELAVEALRVSSVDAAAGRLSQAAAAGGDCGLQLVGRQAYLERCERELGTAELHLEQTRADVAVRRQALNEAARERKTLERLRERQELAHEFEERRAEEATLSEVGLTLYRSRVA
jgi:flagellar export protein FliJ